MFEDQELRLLLVFHPCLIHWYAFTTTSGNSIEVYRLQHRELASTSVFEGNRKSNFCFSKLKHLFS